MKKKRNSKFTGYISFSGNGIFRKVLPLIVFASLLNIQASAQNYLRTVSVNMENESVEQVLAKLNDLGGRCITYKQEEVLKETKKVTIRNNAITILRAVEDCLEGTDLSFTTSQGSILVVPVQASRPKDRTLTGRVTDKNGNVLTGATIMVKGTQIGTYTSSTGSFQLNIPGQFANLPLVCSFLGYKSEEFIPGDKTDITLVLEEDASRIGNVVVTGMFNKDVETYTGAVSVISSEDIINFGGRNLLQTISNIDPAFSMLTDNYSGSNPNSVPNIQIRGAANLPSSIEDLQEQNRDRINTPLILLDGFEISLERMMDLNEHRVESIVLLKDAAATALYGSRAANGIVVITSKTPEEGKLTVRYNGNFAVEAPDLTEYRLLNAAEKLELEKQAGYYSSTTWLYNEQLLKLYNTRYSDVLRGVDTYWLSKPLRTAVPHSHSLYLDGGSDTFRYTAGVSYNRYNGVMKNSYRDNISGNLAISYYHKAFTFSLDLSLGDIHAENSNYGSFSDYARLNPYFRDRDEATGQIYRVFPSQSPFRFMNQPNPLYNASLGGKDYDEQDFWRASFNMDWKPTSSFSTKVRVGVEKAHNESHIFKPAGHTDFLSYTEEDLLRKGSYIYSVGKSTNYNADITASYSKTFNVRHNLFAGVNASVYQDDYVSNTFMAEGFPDPNMDFISAALSYAKNGKPTGSEGVTRNVGFTGNVNYSYDMRYFIDGSIRFDGNSAFGSKNRWGSFWSVGAGWNIHQEKFFGRSDVITRLKLRGSYGVTGTQGFSPYDAMMTYRYITDDRYGYNVGAEIIRLGNENLKWQTTRKTNLGLEISLFENRFVGVFDIYREKTEDLIASIRLPSSNGFNNYIDNLGSIENKGWEFKGTGYIVRNTADRIIWSVTLSMAGNKNKLLKISDSLKEMNESILKQAGQNENDGINPNFLYVEGESLRTIYAVNSLGIDPATGAELFLDRNGKMTETWNAYDQVACGVAEPKVSGSINTFLRVKNMIFSASFGYRLGGHIYNTTLRDKVETSNYAYNVDERVFKDRWMNPGDHANFKGINNRTATLATSRFVQKENTFTFNAISVKYDFSDMRWVKSIGAENITAGFSTNDLLYISSVKRERGISYPFARRFSLTLSATF